MEQEKNSCDCSHWSQGRAYRAGTAVLVLLAIFLLSKSVSEVKGWALIGKDIAPQTTITVSGKGDIVVKPDIATFSFSIEEESLVVGEAQDKVAKSEKSVLDFLAKADVSKDDIKVSGYNIYPRYDYTTVDTKLYPYLVPGKRILAAYVVTESVTVKVRKLSDAGKIIGSMGELGVTNIIGLTFSVDKQDDVLKDARVKAIADAKMSAERLASDLGVSLVRIVSFSENNYSPVPMYYAKESMSVSSAGSDRATPELPSGADKITSNVSLTYEIR